MSDPAPQANKVKLTALLEKVTLIARGADKAGILPDAEEYDAATAPSASTRWCASILRIFLLRVIEHVVATRKAIDDLQKATRDLPAIRDQVSEMSKLLAEIVKAIEMAQAIARGQGPPPNASAPQDDAHAPERSAEAEAEVAHHAQVDEMAAALAHGEKPTDGQPIGRITPIKRVAPSEDGEVA